MDKMMLINAAEAEEARIAVVEGKQLEEYYSERTTKEQIVGNIYKAKVLNIEPSIEAAFLDFGYHKNGFLHVSDICNSVIRQAGKDAHPGRRGDIRRILHRGQEVLVQVTKEGIGNKGPSMSTYLSIPGRFLVLMPDLPRHGVSRKIEDEKERSRLKDILREIGAPEDKGVIVRTAGFGQTKRELGRDLEYLLRLWEQIQKRAESVQAPALIYQESDVVIRCIRDVFSVDVKTICVDSPEVCERVKEFLQMVMPRYVRRVKLHEEPVPLFTRYEIEDQLRRIHLRTVPLKSGAYIVIEQTEALVAIDVNSGKCRREDDPEESAFRVNMEAAQEVAWQLRLRDMGGVIIIDFIDMRSEEHSRQVEKTLFDAMKRDRARIKMLRMSQFGIVELTRQRMRASLSQTATQSCPTCGGLGIIQSAETVSIAAIRQVKARLKDPNLARIEVRVAPAVAEYLLNRMRSRLVALEQESGKEIVVLVDAGSEPGRIDVRCYKDTGEEIVQGGR